MTRADFGRPKIDGMLTTIGEVTITLAALRWNYNRRQAAKAIQMSEGS
jgi:hypothetical protein